MVKAWFKHILLASTVDIIKQLLTILKLQGLEKKQHAYRIPFLITNSILYMIMANCGKVEQIRISQVITIPLTEGYIW